MTKDEKMKILHIADLHLGAKNSKLPKEKQDVLKDEMLENLHYLFCDNAQQFDVCLICGDLFHSKSVPAKVVDNFFHCVKTFEKPVVYIQGNHDEKFIYDKIPENFIILDNLNPFFEKDNFVFHCASSQGELNPTKNNVLLLHGNIENSQDNDYVDINKYLVRNYDYIALGHTHQVKKYKKAGNIFVYSGSLFSCGFDECGDKGFIEVDISDKTVKKCEFKPLAQRRYMICEYDISQDKTNAEIESGIRQSLKKLGVSQKDIVRVVLKGYYQEILNKSISLLTENLSDYFYIEIKDETKFKIDIASFKMETLSLKNEFISLVEGAELSEEEKANIIKLGIEALKGDDLSL